MYFAFYIVNYRAAWSPPTKSNGVITNYTLYDDYTREILFSGLELSTTISGGSTLCSL